MGKIFLNTSAELQLDAPERVTHLLVTTKEPVILSEICINKGDGWMPYYGTVQVDGVNAVFPVELKFGESVITLNEPFEGIGIYLKGYDFLNTVDLAVVSNTGIASEDGILRGIKDITTDGTEILLPSPITGSYEIAKLWCIDTGGIDRSVQFYNKTQNSFWAKSLRANAKLCWIGFQV